MSVAAPSRCGPPTPRPPAPWRYPIGHLLGAELPAVLHRHEEVEAARGRSSRRGAQFAQRVPAADRLHDVVPSLSSRRAMASRMSSSSSTEGWQMSCTAPRLDVPADWGSWRSGTRSSGDGAPSAAAASTVAGSQAAGGGGSATVTTAAATGTCRSPRPPVPPCCFRRGWRTIVESDARGRRIALAGRPPPDGTARTRTAETPARMPTAVRR